MWDEIIYLFLNFNGATDSRFAPSQWETSLQSNAASHWLGTNLESALYLYVRHYLDYCRYDFHGLFSWCVCLSGMWTNMSRVIHQLLPGLVYGNCHLMVVMHDIHTAGVGDHPVGGATLVAIDGAIKTVPYYLFMLQKLICSNAWYPHCLSGRPFSGGWHPGGHHWNY